MVITLRPCIWQLSKQIIKLGDLKLKGNFQLKYSAKFADSKIYNLKG